VTFEADLSGFDRLRQTLREEIADAETTVDYVVGTGVEYSIYLELGTEDMDPKPFVRPAVDEIESRLPQIADDADTADELVTKVALALEREIKQTITEKGLIDTGTLRASVTAIRDGVPSDLPDAGATATADIGVD